MSDKLPYIFFMTCFGMVCLHVLIAATKAAPNPYRPQLEIEFVGAASAAAIQHLAYSPCVYPYAFNTPAVC
jgi:hypothetical protein